MACAAPITIQSWAGPMQVSCKQCLNCRISRQSAICLRAILEQRMSSSADFLTLTYADAPEKIDYSDFSKFLKRLRISNIRAGNDAAIRYLGVGEYGQKTGRAHFHALIFNSRSLSETRLRTRLWPHGFSYIGTVTASSIRYTARYTLKFAAKGEEGVAHWSLRPPLGAPGMIELAAYCRNRGDKLTESPRAVKIEGKTYRLDETMRAVFEDEFCQGGKFDEPSAPAATLRWRTEMLLGDPVADQRRRQAERNRFYETARFISGNEL